MKKKILIVIVAVAMMIPLLAVGASAAQTVIWPEPSGEIDAITVNLKTFNFDNGTSTYVSLPISTLGYTLYRIYLTPNMYPSDTVKNYFGYGYTDDSSIVNTCLVRLYDGEKYLFDGEYDAILANYNEAQLNQIKFRAQYKWTGYGHGEVKVNPGSEAGTFAVVFGTTNYVVGEGSYLDYYVINQKVPLAVDSTNTATVEWYNVVEGESQSPLVTLIELMFDNFSRIIGGIAAGVTGAFTALIWENPEATEKSLSTLAKFIFTIAGLSIGMTVFYLVFRLIRFGRQR